MISRLAHWILRTCGWTPVEQLPDIDKAVFIAVSHTSNWDGVWLIIFKLAMNVRVSFLAKHTLFWWPLGFLLRRWGAIPVDRSQAGSTVRQMVDAFRRNDRLWLALAPEGTRQWKPYWKSGFYQIAMEARVPIFLAFIDYRKKTMGVGGRLDPTGDTDADLAVLRDFYRSCTPKHPELMGPIAFAPAENRKTNTTKS